MIHEDETPSPSSESEEGQAADAEPRTLADLFAGLVGQIASGGREHLSRDTGKRFADYVEEKRRAGRL